jgi:hypothetical protein
MPYEGKLKLRSHSTCYCLIEVVTKAGLTVFNIVTCVLSSPFYWQIKYAYDPQCHELFAIYFY